MISYVDAVKKNWGHFTKVITYVSYKMKFLVKGSRAVNGRVKILSPSDNQIDFWLQTFCVGNDHDGMMYV